MYKNNFLFWWYFLLFKHTASSFECQAPKSCRIVQVDSQENIYGFEKQRLADKYGLIRCDVKKGYKFDYDGKFFQNIKNCTHNKPKDAESIEFRWTKSDMAILESNFKIENLIGILDKIRRYWNIWFHIKFVKLNGIDLYLRNKSLAMSIMGWELLSSNFEFYINGTPINTCEDMEKMPIPVSLLQIYTGFIIPGTFTVEDCRFRKPVCRWSSIKRK